MTIEPFHIDPNHLDTGCSWEGQLDGGTDLDSQQSLLFRVCKRCYFDQESNLPPDILELWQFSQNFFHRRVSLSWIFSSFSSFDCLDLKTSYIGFGLWKLPTIFSVKMYLKSNIRHTINWNYFEILNSHLYFLTQIKKKWHSMKNMKLSSIPPVFNAWCTLPLTQTNILLLTACQDTLVCQHYTVEHPAPYPIKTTWNRKIT